MQTASQLNETFAIPDVLTFHEPHPGMPCARITTPACGAELFLQGAHLARWQPVGQSPVLFLSERSNYAPGKAIRGGVPVIFPWFGAPETSPVHPAVGSGAHGFARTSPWTLRFAALAGDDLHLSLTLDASEAFEKVWPHPFQLAADFTLGSALSIRLSVANTGKDRFVFEEALHTYLEVGDVHAVWIEGLANTEYLDKPDHFARKIQAEAALHFVAETDRPYLNTSAPVTLVDPVLQRRLPVTKTQSNTTVVWNPAAALTAKLPDLSAGDWQHFACIETANAADNAVTLQPGEAHSMTMHLTVDPF